MAFNAVVARLVIDLLQSLSLKNMKYLGTDNPIK